MIINIWTYNDKYKVQELCESLNTESISNIEVNADGELNIYTDKH